MVPYDDGPERGRLSILPRFAPKFYSEGMQSTIRACLTRSAEIKSAIAGDAALTAGIERAAGTLLATIRAGGTIYSCGNGGSACDAMHFTEELVARFKRERPGIRAVHFHDPGTLTCWSNDYSFETVFERQVKTFCGPHDTLVGFSTSGNSGNVVAAVQAARALGTRTIGMLGRQGGRLAPLCDIPLIVPAEETERIQEAHITFVHILCELIETAPEQV